MLNNFYLIVLYGFLIISVVGRQFREMQENAVWKEYSQSRSFWKEHSQARSFVKLSQKTRGVETGLLKYCPDNNKKFKSIALFKNRNNQKRTSVKVSKAEDPFNLASMSLKAKKSSKVFQILLEKLSLTNLKSTESLLKINTIVLYGLSETIFEYWPPFKENHPPLLVVRDTINWQASDRFGRNFLTIVFLGATNSPTEYQLLGKLKHFLQGCHLNKLIFIKETFNRTNNTDVMQLFNWLHINGFWQSMLMDFKGNSVVLQHFTGEFIWNLPLEAFLLQTTNWHNLQGYPIICSMANNPPKALIQYDNQYQVTLKGCYGAIINLFAHHHKASLKPYVISNLDAYVRFDCARYINANKVDICGDSLAIYKHYTVTPPRNLISSYLMVPYEKPLPRFFYFLKPFHLHVWTAVICSGLYKVTSLSFIHRLQHGNWNGGLQMLYAVLSVLHLPFQLIRIKGGYRRFLEIIIISVGFVVANWYLSVLSSLLFTRLYFRDIKTLQDLVHHNISIMVDDFEAYILSNTDIDPIIKQQLLVVSSEVLLQHRRNLDPHYAYCGQYDKLAFYLHQQKYLLRPRMKILKDISINEVMGGIPMNPKWPFQHLLSVFMRRVFESGLQYHFNDHAIEEAILYGHLHYFPTEYHHVEPLSLEYFHMPAMLLAVGYSLAFGCILLELLLLKRRRNQKLN